MDEAFIAGQITFYQTLVSQLQSQILSISTSSTKQYSLNTGQSQQSVTKKTESELTKELEKAIGQLAYWQSIQSGGGASILRPF